MTPTVSTAREVRIRISSGDVPPPGTIWLDLPPDAQEALRTAAERALAHGPTWPPGAGPELYAALRKEVHDLGKELGLEFPSLIGLEQEQVRIWFYDHETKLRLRLTELAWRLESKLQGQGFQVRVTADEG